MLANIGIYFAMFSKEHRIMRIWYVILFVMGMILFSNTWVTDVHGMEAEDYYRERLEFDSEGNLMMTTHDKKATSKITYQTVGWVIKRYDMPIDAPGQQCAYIKLYEYGDIQCRDDPNHPGYIYCYYYGDKEEIYTAIGKASAEWQHQLYAYGDIVYIDSILTICEYGNVLGGLLDSDGNRWGEVYDTYEGIAGARDWADKESLRTHFNKSVRYPSQNKKKEFGVMEQVIYTAGRTYEPEGSLRIGAGEKGKEYFNVEDGIPTGKSLYVDGDVRTYCYNMIFQKVEITMKIPICVETNYHVYWKDYNNEYKSEVKKVTRWYHTKKKVSYWIIDSIDFSYLCGLEVQNYAFQNGKISIDIQGLKPSISQRYFSNYYEHLDMPAYNETIQTPDVVLQDYNVPGVKPVIPDVNYQDKADQAVGKIKVRNDYLSIDGQILLNSQWEQENGTKPLTFVLDKLQHIYKTGYVIPDTKKNSSNNATKVIGIYKKVSDSTRKKIELLAENGVTIHTPVCAKITAEGNKEFNQLVTPDSGIPTLIINREAVVHISAYGTHNNNKGYGTRNYSDYVGNTQMKLPFEIIYQSKRVKENTWFDVELGDVSFVIPIGVDEGKYEIKIRNYAGNSSAVDNIEQHIQSKANTRISNYVATDTITVEVIGRIYGLTVSERSYLVGTNDENGVNQGNAKVLPYTQSEFEGSNINFKLRTTGNMSENDDYIKIEMNYYCVDGNGNRQKVRLYEKKTGSSGYREVDTVIRLKKENRSYAGMSQRYRVSDSVKANQGLQEWRGVLSIPQEVYVIPDSLSVPADVTRETLMLLSIKKGYVIANMEIWTVKNGVRRLSYINRENYEGGYCNMWITEGYRKNMLVEDKTELKVRMGDSILYRINKDYSGLYHVVGTH